MLGGSAKISNSRRNQCLAVVAVQFSTSSPPARNMAHSSTATLSTIFRGRHHRPRLHRHPAACFFACEVSTIHTRYIPEQYFFFFNRDLTKMSGSCQISYYHAAKPFSKHSVFTASMPRVFTASMPRNACNSVTTPALCTMMPPCPSQFACCCCCSH